MRKTKQVSKLAWAIAAIMMAAALDQVAELMVEGSHSTIELRVIIVLFIIIGGVMLLSHCVEHHPRKD